MSEEAGDAVEGQGELAPDWCESSTSKHCLVQSTTLTYQQPPQCFSHTLTTASPTKTSSVHQHHALFCDLLQASFDNIFTCQRVQTSSIATPTRLNQVNIAALVFHSSAPTSLTSTLPSSHFPSSSSPFLPLPCTRTRSTPPLPCPLSFLLLHFPPPPRAPPTPPPAPLGFPVALRLWFEFCFGLPATCGSRNQFGLWSAAAV